MAPIISLFARFRPVKSLFRVQNFHSGPTLNSRKSIGAHKLKRGGKRESLEDLGVVVGSRHHGFLTTSVEDVKEFGLRVVQLVHENTKARHVHIDTADTNNAFGVVFRTPPNDSTGLPHILEHMVLCGSEKYPIRDPFFNMLKRSLQTFMNAMTGSDSTSYPFATRNEQDFANLLSVYLDATFFPLLKPNDFHQEGHRLDFSAEEKLIRSGVVYNEMKGRRSSSSSLFLYEMGEKLLEDSGSCYEFSSAGIPEDIPKLNHETLVKFHSNHYHPSNSLLFTYGDLPLPNHLKTVEENVTSKFEFNSIASSVGHSLRPTNLVLQALNEHSDEILQNNEKDEKKIVISGPLDGVSDPSSQVKFCLMKTLDFETNDEYSALVMRVLSSLLLEGLNSPMYSALIGSKMAPDYSPGAGYDGYLLVPTFSLGVQGVSEDKIPAIKEIILKELDRVVHEGFPEKMVEATLHQIELVLKHKQTHFGLMMLQAVGGAWTHSIPQGNEMVDLEKRIYEAVTVNDKLERLRKEMKEDKMFWQKYLKKMVVDTRQPFVSFVMKPDEKYLVNLEKNEKEGLTQIEDSLSDAQKEEIKVMNEVLANERDAKQDVSCLPTLTLKDIPRKAEDEVDLLVDSPWLSFADTKESTNGVVYLSFLFDGSKLETNEGRMLLPLLCSLLGNVDCDEISFQDLSLETQLHSGGINCSAVVPHWLGGDEKARDMGIEGQIMGDGTRRFRQGVLVQTHCLKRNLSKTLELLCHTLAGPDFGSNEEHLSSLIASASSTLSNGVMEDPLGFARRWANAPFAYDGMLNELLSGVSQVEMVNSIHEQMQRNPSFISSNLCPSLETLSSSLFRPEKLNIAVVCDEADRIFVTNELSFFRQSLAWNLKSSIGMNFSDLGLHLPADPGSKAVGRSPDAWYLPLPIAVHNCVAMLSTGVDFDHKDSAALSVLSELASSNFLHPMIRERGGAYGAVASHNQSGMMTLASYYDPQSNETMNVFKDSLSYLCNGDFDERDVQEALLSILGGIDAPKKLSSRGTGEFMHGLSAERKQKYRDTIFDLDRSKLISAAERHLKVFVDEGADFNDFSNINANEKLNGKLSSAIIGNAESVPQFPSSKGWKSYKFK